MDTVTFDEIENNYSVDVDGLVSDVIPSRELWNLDFTLARFILPRLAAFRSEKVGYPTDIEPEQYEQDLDMMIAAFKLILKDDIGMGEDEMYTIETGLALFAKHFRSLWW
jgi:hypothetical protein